MNTSDTNVFLNGSLVTSPIAEERMQPILQRMPGSLLHCVADFLDPGETRALSMVSSRFNKLLGPRSVRTLAQANKKETLKALQLMERDLPDHVVCVHCIKLHKIVDAQKYMLDMIDDGPNLPCAIHYDKLEVDFRISDRFSGTVFEMAMKHHRQGRDTKYLLQTLSGRQFLQWESSEYCFIGEKATFRIFNDSILVQREISYQFTGEYINSEHQDLPIEVCAHRELQVAEDHSIFVRPGTISFRHDDKVWTPDFSQKNGAHPYTMFSDTRSCCYCLTDYEVTIDYRPGEGTELNFTTWKDLGNSITGNIMLSHIVIDQDDVLDELAESNNIPRDRTGLEYDPPKVSFISGEIKSDFLRAATSKSGDSYSGNNPLWEEFGSLSLREETQGPFFRKPKPPPPPRQFIEYNIKLSLVRAHRRRIHALVEMWYLSHLPGADDRDFSQFFSFEEVNFILAIC